MAKSLLTTLLNLCAIMVRSSWNSLINFFQKKIEVHKKNPLYNKVIPEGTVNFIWNVFSKLEDDSSIGTISNFIF